MRDDWLRSWMRLLGTVPRMTGEALKGKYAGWKASKRLRHPLREIPWNSRSAEAALADAERMFSMNGRSMRAPVTNMLQSEEDRELVELIHNETTRSNRSNITRTAAYLECYNRFPELHWALLAHLVSRNGGYNMTDLKGGLMEDLMTGQQREWMYRLLERCNALIFQDAYPQLLLYTHSRRLGRSCFHLLPFFHVSAFMVPFWDRFWTLRDSPLLTVALIINEQHYIEERVIRNPYFQKHVTRCASFRVHDWLHLNQIVFPLGQDSGLAGLIIEHFTNLNERIGFGKSLYALLFGYEQVLTQAHSFAQNVPHKGSRSEYWPQLFTPDIKKALHSPYESAALNNKERLPSNSKLYSPTLEQVWSDTPYEPIPRYDWFQGMLNPSYLSKPRRPFLFEMTHEHRFGIRKTAAGHDAEILLQ
ncbi:DUF2515 domain-containing protein [Paenibacillus sp. P96]|uniref:DUF2515 domain-containing protein n=1 Tax=Paenibacillus zeirhizosphaerae TaxID=2987519 RepID=A0ABT9FUK3_9BACL|nr:DUF2515 family protein [Paenibacillus sp. P96]MDP4098422.1 DUF2515 domain-containing protein [Paenibacillus sp. P96]